MPKLPTTVDRWVDAVRQARKVYKAFALGTAARAWRSLAAQTRQSASSASAMAKGAKRSARSIASVSAPDTFIIGKRENATAPWLSSRPHAPNAQRSGCLLYTSPSPRD